MDNLTEIKFRKIYTYINFETLCQASKENPQLVEELINSKTSDLVKAHAIQALGDQSLPEYFQFLLGFKDSDSALLRESACIALRSYFYDEKIKYQVAKDIFESIKRKETEPGVLKQIEICLTFLKQYKWTEE